MLCGVSRQELRSEQIRSIKDLLLKDKSWWHYHQKHKDTIRDEVVNAISSILSCRLSARGFSCYECKNPDCTHIKKVPFSCHHRFCNTCGKKATENWTQRQLSILPDCDWQHITFTMPREFWRFFQENWPLLNQLPTVGANILKKIGKNKGFLPGIFIALHTFGRDLKNNPHLHASVTRGGLNDKETTFINGYFKKKVLMRMWRYGVIDLLKSAYKDGTLKIPDSLKSLCPDYKSFAAWLNRRLHKTWIVHVAKPTKSPKITINYLGRYIKRPPIAQSRLRHYNGNFVSFSFLNHKSKKHQDFHCSTEEFIRRFTQHIPSKNFRIIRYYGFLANRVRSSKLAKVRSLLGQQPSPTPYNLKWAELMVKTFGVNPKQCILCKSEMDLKYRRIGANAKFFNEQHDNLALRKKIVA